MNNNIQELLIDIDVEDVPSSDEIREFLINLRNLEACSSETEISQGGEEGPVLAIKSATYKEHNMLRGQENSISDSSSSR